MKTLPAGLDAALASGVTTLCHCWKLTRSDGAVRGFTDHDRDLAFDGVTFEAGSGFAASPYTATLGLSVDTMDARGPLAEEALTEADLARGLWDNAQLVVYRVDWGDVANRVVVVAGVVGEVMRQGAEFTAELRGLQHALNQDYGRTYSATCNADLGDARCTIDIDLPQFKGAGTVTSALSRRVLRASGLGAFESGWFQRGLLTWATGANAPMRIEVKVHTLAGATATIELFEEMPADIESGDTFTVTAGCDKTFQTCKAKFDNALNFRGFPQMPGNDWVTSLPKRGDIHDGGSLAGLID
ncbi:MAG: DUF2163 domain-containing protein [Rhizobiales bacterium]|nr:DUF2163 domain-containing protein [Hyphomicrobiales bacterium]